MIHKLKKKAYIRSRWEIQRNIGTWTGPRIKANIKAFATEFLLWLSSNGTGKTQNTMIMKWKQASSLKEAHVFWI